MRRGLKIVIPIQPDVGKLLFNILDFFVLLNRELLNAFPEQRFSVFLPECHKEALQLACAAVDCLEHGF